jgi:hypothetical protein
MDELAKQFSKMTADVFIGAVQCTMKWSGALK